MNDFQQQLKIKMDKFAHEAYRLTKNFPKEELYGTANQLRRSSLSVILNYIEGFARKKAAVKKNFWETSYGSLKEAKYLLYFCMVEGYLDEKDYEKADLLAEEIGAMLWKCIEGVKI